LKNYANDFGEFPVARAREWWGKGNYKSDSPHKKFPPRSEDGSAGGGLGEECRAVRAWKPRRSARKLEGRNRAEISLSFLEFFSGGARKIKIVRENFCEVAAEALAEAGGGAESVRFR